MVRFWLLRRDVGLIPTKCISVYQSPDEASNQLELSPVADMTRHYSTRDLNRNTPNALLARYFKARVVLQGFDFTAIKETKIDAVDGRSASDSCPDELLKVADTLPSNDYVEVKRQQTVKFRV